ncbi:MAG: hypothetical protein Q4A92_04150 [Corynebacterium sp.]|nr:hypothetical protein [Corynebacterium sp.]
MNITRIVPAGFIAVITALPDYIPNPWLRRLVTAALVAGGLYYINTDDDPENDITLESLDFDGTEDGPVTTWLKITAVIGAVFGLAKLRTVVAASLRNFGIRTPNTILGLIAGAAIVRGCKCNK